MQYTDLRWKYRLIWQYAGDVFEWELGCERQFAHEFFLCLNMQVINTVHGSEIRQSPVEVGSASPNLRRVLAPSKRWLALGFLNHQQCWLSLNFSSSAWTNTQRHWYICIPNTLWGGTWTPKTLPKKTFSAGICKGECSLQSQVYTKDLNKSTCKTTWCFFKKFSWRNWIWEVPSYFRCCMDWFLCSFRTCKVGISCPPGTLDFLNRATFVPCGFEGAVFCWLK